MACCIFQMLSGYLRANGLRIQRARVRSVLTDTNPVAAASRWSRTVARRLWRDVHKEVTQLLYMKFYDMEDAGKLQADDELHRFALHTVFLPLINEKLTNFVAAWNMHRVRTAKNKTPNQLWIEGMLHTADVGPETVAAELSDHRENLHDRVASRLTELGVETGADTDTQPVSEQTSFVLTALQQQELQQCLDSIADIDVKFDACIGKLVDFGFRSGDL